MSYLEYEYLADGTSAKGSKIPDLPVVELLVHVAGRRQALTGPALVDTGFDGAIYANLAIATYLEGLRPKTSEILGAPGRTIECEVYEGSCSLAGYPKPKIDLGRVDIHVATSPTDLTENVLVGREILNRLELLLDGRRVRTRVR